MKNMWAKVNGMVFIAILVLNACAGSQTKKAIQTDPAIPTIGPTSVPVLLGSYATLSPEDMRHDLDEVFKQIEANHPDPYVKRPKTEVDLERQRIDQELSQPLTVIDFYKKAAPLVASLGDHHTQILLSNKIWEEIDSKERFFPLEVAFQGHQAFVITNHAGNPDIPLGAKLLAINGIALTDVQSRFLRVRDMPFSMQLWFLTGSIPEYQVDMLPSGKTTPLQFIVPGLTLAEITKQGVAAPPWEPLTYRTLPGEKIGILTINSFFEMTDLLKPAFAQIQKDEVQHLILDIRANRGGYYEALARLMDYLTDQPYQTCSRKYNPPRA